MEYPHEVKFYLHQGDPPGGGVHTTIGMQAREDGLIDLYFKGNQPNLIVGRPNFSEITKMEETVLTLHPDEVELVGPYRAPWPAGKKAV